LVQSDSKYEPNRQYFTIGEGKEKQALKAFDASLETYGVKDGSVLQFKDLGLQVGWRTVFFVEYGGPIVIHALFYLFPQIFYSRPLAPKGYAQQ
jgi:very-long-chain enoyl-CoA reductase